MMPFDFKPFTNVDSLEIFRQFCLLRREIAIILTTWIAAAWSIKLKANSNEAFTEHRKYQPFTQPYSYECDS